MALRGEYWDALVLTVVRKEDNKEQAKALMDALKVDESFEAVGMAAKRFAETLGDEECAAFQLAFANYLSQRSPEMAMLVSLDFANIDDNALLRNVTTFVPRMLIGRGPFATIRQKLFLELRVAGFNSFEVLAGWPPVFSDKEAVRAVLRCFPEELGGEMVMEIVKHLGMCEDRCYEGESGHEWTRAEVLRHMWVEVHGIR